MDRTISAISTAYGEGGIGIIRISGSKAKNIADDIFTNKDKLEDRRLIFGHIFDENNKNIDEALVVYMKAPKTYTGEDIVEIQCHGSIVSLRKILDLTLRKGAELAERGEFTKRAFLNGRMDLSQAEAVIDLIKAKNESSFDLALKQLEGKFSKEIVELRKKILDILVNITVNIDYPDEDIEEILYDNLLKEISQIGDELENIIGTADTGKIIREGLKVSIIGKPNVGKSSLMNLLLREDRAIVTDIEGTTRDTIEEELSIRGIPVVLTDTAGIRETEDKIEQIGIEKSKESFNKSDLVIFIVDGSRNLSDEDFEIIDVLKDKKSIVVLNKIDLERKIEKSKISELLGEVNIIETSMEENIGIEDIKDRIEELVLGGTVAQSESSIVSNARHLDLLCTSKQSIRDAQNLVSFGEALELIEIDVRNAYESLGEIIGEEVKDDILEEVFNRFCLGK